MPDGEFDSVIMTKPGEDLTPKFIILRLPERVVEVNCGNGVLVNLNGPEWDEEEEQYDFATGDFTAEEFATLKQVVKKLQDKAKMKMEA